MISCGLIPQSGIETLKAGKHYQMIGGDPQFAIDLAGANNLPKGYYKFTLEGDDLDRSLVQPRLYFDLGDGFQEQNAVNLSFRKRGERSWDALVIFGHDVCQLRFDPATSPGPLHLRAANLQQLTRLQFYSQCALKLLKSEVKSPRSAAILLRRVFDVVKRGGLRSLAAKMRGSLQLVQGTISPNDYQRWIELYDTLTEADRAQQRKYSKRLAHRPLISIIMPTYNTPESLLSECIESVIAQTYDNWELCIADDASTLPHVRRILKAFILRDRRIKVVFRSENGHISEASNSALELAEGQWVALLDHDDLLAPNALYFVAKTINENPEAGLIYSDEDKVDSGGRRHDPYFKCDWNYDLFLSHNLITHLGVYRGDLVRSIGGFRSEYDGAQDYDLALRCIAKLDRKQIIHIPRILYHWRVIPGSTAMGSSEKPYAMLAGERALNDFLSVNGIDARAELIGFGFRVHYSLPKHAPLVSIIIPTRNAHVLVETCINSIHERTTYPNFEILLVDNGSDDPHSLSSFESMAKRGLLRVHRDDRPFNYSALNNAAVAICNGSVVALVNNDIEVISPHWLDEMVSLALRPNVGAVGAKLYYPDDTLQHGGVILGLGGLAAHMHDRLPRSSAGYVGRAALRQELSAVTAACLVVRKSTFQGVGGLNEKDLTVAYNDVDLCLKIADSGLLNVWTPFAELYHHESATRGYETSPEKQRRFELEKLYMLEKWSHLLFADPAYSPNLTLERADFSIAFPPRNFETRKFSAIKKNKNFSIGRIQSNIFVS